MAFKIGWLPEIFNLPPGLDVDGNSPETGTPLTQVGPVSLHCPPSVHPGVHSTEWTLNQLGLLALA